MEYTREPIVQCVIAARDGNKLYISDYQGKQLYVVDSLQVVLFGDTPFYRNIEGTVEFMCPAAHHSIEEKKESKMALKIPQERKIKISASEKEEAKAPKQRKKTRKKEPKTVSVETNMESVALFQPPSVLISESIQAVTKKNVVKEATVEKINDSKEAPELIPDLIPHGDEKGEVILENLDD